MGGTHRERPGSNPPDRSVDADVLLRQEPDEEEDEEEEEDEGDGKEKKMTMTTQTMATRSERALYALRRPADAALSREHADQPCGE